MSTGQKVIKILALVLAGFIIVNIFSAIIFGISAFSGYMYQKENKDIKYEEIVGTLQEEMIKYIENLNDKVKIKIDLATYHLEVKRGAKLSVETTGEKEQLKCAIHGSTLEIKEKNHNWFWKVKEGVPTVVIYIPENITLDELKIEMGVGKVSIEEIEVHNFKLDAGAGKVIISNMTTQTADIDGGAGSFEATDCIFNDLNLDCGVGATKISGNITGRSKVSCGVGRTEFNLAGKEEEYSIRTETGLGAMTLNGKKCSDDAKYGEGESKIEIEAGVGSVEITTK